MNNENVIRIINENGINMEYGTVPDLWHIAQWFVNQKPFGDERDQAHCDEILKVWHMAHDLKAVIEGQGEARLLVVQRPSHWESQAGHPVEDWRAECMNDDTRLGYLDWCDARREQAAS